MRSPTRFLRSPCPSPTGRAQTSAPRRSPSIWVHSLVASAVLSLTTPSALAVISENEFVRDNGPVALGTKGSAYFVPQRVLRTEPVLSHDVLSLGSQDSIQILTDRHDGSTVLRRGNLGLDLSKLSLGDGQSIQDKLQGSLTNPERANLERVITQSLLQRLRDNPSLAIRAGTLALDRTRSLFGPEFTSLSFNLFVEGRRVAGTEITARFKNGLWISLTTDSFGAAEGRAKVLKATDQSRVSLDEIARTKLGPAYSHISAREEVLVPERSNQGYTLIPSLQSTLTDMTGQTYTLTVSQVDGSILEFYAHRYNFDGVISGSFYQRHPETPLVTSGMPYISIKNGGLFSRRSFTADKDGRLRVPRTQEVVVKLISPFVAVNSSSGQSAQIVATSDAAFVPEDNATAAEVTTYYHTNVINDFVRERISQKLPWLDKQIRATVNLSSTCNAFYNGTINFFSAGAAKRRDGTELKCNNTGEIADVVYHEWGHGLDDNTGGIDDGAFSEAIGDVVSMLITNSPKVGPYFIADGSPVRNLDGEYQYPPKPDEREVHVEGLIFGSTWYHLTQDLIEKYGSEVGRDTSARMFLKLIFTASRYTDAYAAAIDIDSERGEKGPNYCLINGAFARHGLAEADASCQG